MPSNLRYLFVFLVSSSLKISNSSHLVWLGCGSLESVQQYLKVNAMKPLVLLCPDTPYFFAGRFVIVV